MKRTIRLLSLLLAVVLLEPGRVTRADDDHRADATRSGARETFSITYTIEITPGDPERARVRWDLAGIDEIERVRLRFDADRFSNFESSGTLERRRGEVLWWPEGPYADLSYVARVDHRRAAGKGYDSYAGNGWIVSRTADLFPRSAVRFRREIEPDPESRARLVLRLPKDWQAVTVMPPDGPHRYVVESPHHRLDHPRGWLLLGHLRRTDTTIGSTAVTVATVPGVTIQPDAIVQLLRRALPLVDQLFDRPLPRLVIVVAPDPMWRGGLSGEASFYIHGDRPLRSPDRTSPYLHELFHVAAPFRPSADGHWVTEGLAEYYSLELQRRIGLVTAADYERALGLFARHGVWGQDFTRTTTPALRNNSAPLVMHALDRDIRAATSGEKGLDAAVTSLARDGGVVSTARFLGAVERAAGKSFAEFFRRHVYAGESPVPSP